MYMCVCVCVCVHCTAAISHVSYPSASLAGHFPIQLLPITTKV